MRPGSAGRSSFSGAGDGATIRWRNDEEKKKVFFFLKNEGPSV